jgi:hypothetical protein
MRNKSKRKKRNQRRKRKELPQVTLIEYYYLMFHNLQSLY